jgi:cyclic pyranopterin phosphate synthase
MTAVVPVQFFEQASARSGKLEDRFGRRLNYMRISVTDRCNMRCHYCRPQANDYKAGPKSHMLSFEEIERIVRVGAGLGLSKLRITGGEPLVRRGVSTLVRMLASIPGITDLAMSTNAFFLEKHIEELSAAGLMRLNISLDSLHPLRFRQLTGSDVEPVLAGIRAAIRSGLSPIKLNTVLMRGINDTEVPALIDFAEDHGLTIRFIELMPMKRGMDWEKHYVPVDEVMQRPEVTARLGTAAGAGQGNSAARYLPLASGHGEVGFITPMSDRFCEGCNRLRLTADGKLRSCLPSENELNLRDMIRAGGNDDDVRTVFTRSALIKPEIGTYNYDQPSRSMIQVGG